jgi:hypothetical protein
MGSGSTFQVTPAFYIIHTPREEETLRYERRRLYQVTVIFNAARIR